MLRNRDMTLGIVSELGVAEEIDLRLDGTLVVFKTAAQRRAFTEDLEFAVANGLVSEGELIGSAEVLKVCRSPCLRNLCGSITDNCTES